MINTATKIIKNSLVEGILAMIGDNLNYRHSFTAQDVMDWCDDCLENNCDEYDEDWFPIMGVPSAKMSVDWEHLADYINDTEVDYQIEIIFED
jgi:hypothetical protein